MREGGRAKEMWITRCALFLSVAFGARIVCPFRGRIPRPAPPFSSGGWRRPAYIHTHAHTLTRSAPVRYMASPRPFPFPITTQPPPNPNPSNPKQQITPRRAPRCPRAPTRPRGPSAAAASPCPSPPCRCPSRRPLAAAAAAGPSAGWPGPPWRACSAGRSSPALRYVTHVKRPTGKAN